VKNKSYKNLNLACGSIFVVSEEWENCDFSPMNKHVKHIDLLARFPYLNETFDSIYCSHFIEHISLDDLCEFFSECLRVLKPNGIIRIVLPDFENIVREYLSNIENGKLQLSQFNIVELIDQCTRKTSGGQLSKWSAGAFGDSALQGYISLRTGILQDSKQTVGQILGFTRMRGITIRKFLYRIQRVLIFKLVSFFPKWFTQNHVSKVATGEQHLWMHDFNSIAEYLSDSGFINILKLDEKTSNITGFPYYPLDLNAAALPRKGNSSMYVEAFKSC
jgi:predicted SAM-dependent methyltransferase